jgi:hypothetical protein
VAIGGAVGVGQLERPRPQPRGVGVDTQDDLRSPPGDALGEAIAERLPAHNILGAT